MTFTRPLRLPFRLRCNSVAAQLLRHGWYVAPPPLFVADLYPRLLVGDPFADVLEVNGTAVAVDMRNSQFIAADRACFPDGYEPDVAAAIDLLLPDDGVLIDAGANWGCFALQAALRPGFHGRVVAIEPAPRPARDLAALTAALGLPVTLLRLALGAADGTAQLSQPVLSGGASLIDPAGGGSVLNSSGGASLLDPLGGARILDPAGEASMLDPTGSASLADPAGGAEVAVRRLDGLDLPPPDIIKLDIEGGELAALRGGGAWLARHRPAIVMECRTDTPGGEWAAPLHLLAGLGYAIFALDARPDPASGSCELNLTPMRPAARGDFPLHLNILAVADMERLKARA